MDGHAVRTLRTRAFYRSFAPSDVPRSYYDYAAGRRAEPWTDETEHVWRQASDRACQLKLGESADDRILDERISLIAKSAAQRGLPWVLVGGPPCQAFSLVGRARNAGMKHYVAKEDHRHYLYQHYLKILSRHRPAAFVLENVKGMLSSHVDGQNMFEEIFESLHRPSGRSGPRYRIVPLVQQSRRDDNWGPKDFIIRSERLGLPQTRHRVILLGINEEIDVPIQPLLELGAAPTVGDMISDLPEIRSSATDADTSSWKAFAPKLLAECARIAKKIDTDTARLLGVMSAATRLGKELDTGAAWIPGKVAGRLPSHLSAFLRDHRVHGVIQHQSRPHMTSDLMRYAYAAAFAHVHGRSPRGAAEFPLELHPDHKNWGRPDRFVDRFKVQRANSPSSTITSHLAKDGHYFIHFDPSQVRSLSVREAARLQTFPDNYIFEGPLGAQRKQVGNAVPPWLGYQIAGVLHRVLK
ncbi:DNA cytosine methyltransferase [Dyella japonica]|uniref:DNA cytosine methyltransferase n=1 Tax=Dyella japonica TaxID=231455 RepID=UPI0009DAF740|nr:DNA (cytosine-5-)-methyltransferase [Dyella japonica]